MMWRLASFTVGQLLIAGGAWFCGVMAFFVVLSNGPRDAVKTSLGALAACLLAFGAGAALQVVLVRSARWIAATLAGGLLGVAALLAASFGMGLFVSETSSWVPVAPALLPPIAMVLAGIFQARSLRWALWQAASAITAGGAIAASKVSPLAGVAAGLVTIAVAALMGVNWRRGTRAAAP